MNQVFKNYATNATAETRARTCSALFFKNKNIRYSTQPHQVVLFQAQTQSDASELLLALMQCDEDFFKNCVYVESTSRVCGLALADADRRRWMLYRQPNVTLNSLLTIDKSVFGNQTGSLASTSSVEVVSEDDRLYGCGRDWDKEDVNPPPVFHKTPSALQAISEAFRGSKELPNALEYPDRVIETYTEYSFGPFVLVLLSRNEHKYDATIKIPGSEVKMPLEVTIELRSGYYELASTLYHVGNTWKNGHYVAKVAVADNGTNVGDYLCNDKEILNRPAPHTNDFATKFGRPRGEPERPYMLLYKHSDVPWLRTKPEPINNLGNSCYANALVQFLRPLTVNLESVTDSIWYKTWAKSVAERRQDA